MSDLDVAMRLRLLYSGNARAAEADLKRLRAAGQRLGGRNSGSARLADNLTDATLAARKADRSLSRLGRSAGRDLDRAAQASGRLGRNLALVSAATSRAQTGMRGVSKAAVAAGAMRGGQGGRGAAAGMVAGRMMGGFSVKMLGALGAGYGIVKTTQSSLSLERSMYDVERATDASGEALKRYETRVLDLSRETGKTKEELAGVMAAAGFAGRPKEELEQFTKYAAMATTAWGTSAQETGQAMAEIGNIYQANQGRIEEIGDAINTVADTGAAAESDLLDFLRRSSGLSKSLPISAEQIVAWGAAFKEVGVRTEVASTGFNAFMLKLGTASEENKDFQDGLKQLGLSAKAVEKGMRVDASGTMLKVLELASKSKDPLKVLRSLGGREYADDFATLSNNLPGVVRMLDLVTNKSNYLGSVAKGFELIKEKDFNKLDRAAQSLDVLATRLGNVGKVAAGDLAEGLNKFVDSVEKGDSFFQRVDKYFEDRAKMQAELNGGKVEPTALESYQQGSHNLGKQIRGLIGLDPDGAFFDGWFGASGKDAGKSGADAAFYGQLEKDRQIALEWKAKTQAYETWQKEMPTASIWSQMTHRGPTIDEVRQLDAEMKIINERWQKQHDKATGALNRSREQGAAQDGFMALGGMGDALENPLKQLPAAAQDSMGRYNAFLTSEGQKALGIADDIVGQLAGRLSFDAKITISPTLSAPGVSAPAGAAKPQKTSSIGGSRTINIASVNVSGVRDVASLEREISRSADRTAKAQRDDALHGTGGFA